MGFYEDLVPECVHHQLHQLCVPVDELDVRQPLAMVERMSMTT